MKDTHKLSVTLTDGGASVIMEGDAGDLLAAWCVLADSLSKTLNIPVEDLAANLPEAVSAVMEIVQRGAEVSIDINEFRRQTEGAG